MIYATVTITPEAMRELSQILQASMRESMKRQTRKLRIKLIFPSVNEHTAHMTLLWRIYRESIPFADGVEVQR